MLWLYEKEVSAYLMCVCVFVCMCKSVCVWRGDYLNL